MAEERGGRPAVCKKREGKRWVDSSGREGRKGWSERERGRTNTAHG